MALSASPPARVFAELLPAPAPTPLPVGGGGGGPPPAPSGREVHVSGSAELSAGPDRARVSLRLSSRKGEAGEARSSVARRLEYIAQAARQRGVPCQTEEAEPGDERLQLKYHIPNCLETPGWVDSQEEENMTITEDFSRVEDTYQMEAEVCVIFSDFGKMQSVCNLLVEKLGTSVTVSPPHFYHTPEAADALRRQVCVAAVENTRRKAQEVCRLFGLSLGKPVLIKEEETKEWGGPTEGHVSNSPDSLTLQERIQNATAHASCRVFAVFEIKGKENRRNKLL